MDWNSCLGFIVFSLQYTFNIPFKVGLLARYSFCFYFIWEVFILPSVLKQFSRCKISDSQVLFFFSISIFIMSSYYLLASTVSDKLVADSIGFLLQVKNHFSFATFKIFSLSLYFNILAVMCLSVDQFIFFLLGIHWASWIRVLFFMKSGEFVAIIYLNYFLLSSLLLVLSLCVYEYA